MFFLLSLLLYIKGRVTPIKWMRRLLFSGCFISWIMALGSKEIAVTLPLIVLLYEWWFFQDLQLYWLRANWKYFFLIFVVAGLMAFIYLGGSPVDTILRTYEQRDFTILDRGLTQFRVLVFYISLLIFPHPSRLNLLHNISISHSLFEPITTLFSLGIIAGLIGFAIYMANRERLVSFCILWFFVNLVIESSLIGLEIIYEHRLYLPMFGFALLLSYLLFHSLLNRRLLAMGLSICIILSLGTATYLRNGVWKDNLIFWSDVVSKNPQNHRAHVALGNVLKDMGRKREAIEQYEEALRIKADYVKGHNNLGIALEEQGRIEEAIEHYYEALRIRPGIAETNYNLGNALASQRRFKEAISHYEEAIRIKPDYAKAHNGLGSALKAQGRIKEATSHYEEALRIRSDYASAHNNLGVILLRQGKLREAIGSYEKALRIRPSYAEAHYNLGNALASQRRFKEATSHYEEALRIRPDYASAHNNLGVILLRQGKLKEAEGYFSNAIRISPGIAEVHNNLGVALLRQEKLTQAIEHFSEAVRIKPNYEEAQKNLEAALRNTRKTRED